MPPGLLRSCALCFVWLLWLLAPAFQVEAADPAAVDAYLHREGRAFDPASGAGAELIEPRGRSFYLLGEMHGVAANNQADLGLLKYLHRTAGVRTYVSEISYSYGSQLNRYLESGDPGILDFLFAKMNHSGDRSADKRRFWSDLRDWNSTLPAAEGIRIVGVDLERFDPEITVANLRWILRSPAAPRSLRPVVEQVGRFPVGSDDPAVRRLAAALRGSVDRDRAAYAGWLGAQGLEDLELSLGNLEQRFHGQDDPAHFDEWRDAAQYRNLRRIVARLPAGSIYGRMGSAHVLQRRFDECDRLSVHLEGPDSPWAGRVIGIWPVYDHCQNLAYVNGAYTAVPCSDDPALAKVFARSARGPLTLFKLDGRDSPFRRPADLAGRTWTWKDNGFRLPSSEATPLPVTPGGFAGGATADYFQYVLLFHGAAAARPLPGT